VSDPIAGEVWWGGHWVPSCERCAKKMRAVWHETLHAATCDGCGQRMVSAWLVEDDR
jgi:hypothetical protein